MIKRYAVYVTGQTPPQRLGTVTAPDRHTAIKKAIDLYEVPETSLRRLDLVLVMPPKSKRIKVRDGREKLPS